MFDKFFSLFFLLITDCYKSLESLLLIQSVEIVTMDKIKEQLAIPCEIDETEQCQAAFHSIAKPIIDEICARISKVDLNLSE